MQYRRLPELTIRLRADGRAEMFAYGLALDGGLFTLAILEIFTQPHTVESATERLTLLTHSDADRNDLSNQISELIRAGVLIPADVPTLVHNAQQFDAPPIHIAMLNDRFRTGRYLTAIKEVVQPGDVVVEIGTGTGILAVGAAKAGAQQIYTIEGTSIARVAEKVFAANGVADQIRVIEGWSTRVDVPERADVLISEILGNEPLGEGLLETTQDAVDRFLKPGGRMIPSEIRLYALPLTLPDDLVSEQVFEQSKLARWKKWYSVDFTPLLEMNANMRGMEMLPPQDLEDCPLLSDPVLIEAIDLHQIQALSFERSVQVKITEEGLLNGLLVGFRLQLAPNLWLSTLPGEADEENHWLAAVRVLQKAIPVQPGDVLRIDFRYDSASRLQDFDIHPMQS
jgi:protein arginine N-methyltransferase 1